MEHCVTMQTLTWYRIIDDVMHTVLAW